MPPHFCHPNTPHKKLKLPEWYVSTLMMDRALDAVVRRVKNLDRKHDVPYLAGYSRDGKTIYIDRHMPKMMHYDGRDIDTDRYLVCVQVMQVELIDQRFFNLLMQNQIAVGVDVAAVVMHHLRHVPVDVDGLAVSAVAGEIGDIVLAVEILDAAHDRIERAVH